MKMIKNKVLSVLLSVLLLFTANGLTLTAYADGTGTESNPYQISTAEQLQAINNNVSAHYILTEDIDLKGVDFTPIGNADSGAFTGSFDGNGHTISNLNVFSGKYAGLFGCNEGVIQNVTLSEIYVYGTRYLGGVVAENTALGVVSDCVVQSGVLESDGGINSIHAGGICGTNSGELSGSFENGASVTVSNDSANAYAGGILGYSTASLEMNAAVNTGNVSSSTEEYSYSGGLVGYGSGTITVTDSCNTGNVSSASSSSSYDSYSGGLVGYVDGTVTVDNSYNTGIVSSSSNFRSYSGGLVGNGNSTVTVRNSYNTGSVSCSSRSPSCSGGLVGQADGDVIITASYNTGNVSSHSFSSSYYDYTSYSGGLVGMASSTVTVSNSYNTGNVSSSPADSYSGGLVGQAYGDVTISNSYNTGNVYGASSDSYSGGLVGQAYGDVTVTDSYNTGNVYGASYDSYSGGLVGYGSGDVTVSNSYNTGNVYGASYDSYSGGLVGQAYGDVTVSNSYARRGYRSGASGTSGSLKTEAELRERATFTNWDFSEVWRMGESCNGGFPVLQNTCAPLQLNLANAEMLLGDTLQLTAYQNGVQTSAVTWSVTNGAAVVSSTGLVTADTAGFVTVTATDAQGNKANCNLYVMTANPSVALNNFSLNQGNTDTRNVALGVGTSGDFLTAVTSSDPAILTISGFGGTKIAFSAKSAGVVTVSFETAQGRKGTCTATVTNTATSLSLPSSLTLARGSQKQLTATTTPSPTSSRISWTSSDPNVAAVGENGVVTGVSAGTAVITAKTDNGYSDTCTVTVNVPCTSLAFEEPSVTVEKGATYQLRLIADPADTTESISYSSSSSSRVSVSSSGLLTAKSTGTVTVTASASGGAKAYCNVTVVDAVSSVTLGETNKSVLVGDSFKLEAVVSPSGALNKNLTYSSDNDEIAEIDNQGNVLARAPGITILRVTAPNGVSAACLLQVRTVSNLADEAGTPYFEIYTPQDLVLFAECVNTRQGYSDLDARLCADLDLSEVCGQTLGAFTPIGSSDRPYTGSFNGNGFTIHNLYVDASKNSGLFGVIGENASISDLTLENAAVRGESYVGGIVGYNDGGRVYACAVNGAITGTYFVGGVCGYNNGGVVNACAVTGSVSGANVVGGVVGYNGNASASGQLLNSFCCASVNADDIPVGGLCAYNEGVVSGCYYDNTLESTSAMDPVGDGKTLASDEARKSTEDFASGQVAYLLNQSLGKTVFYQTLGTDSAPVLQTSHATVYCGYASCNTTEKSYSNTPLSETVLHHTYVNGFCTICGAEQYIVIFEPDMHAEGLRPDKNTVIQLQNELETDDLCIKIQNVKGERLDEEALVGTGATITFYSRSKNQVVRTVTVVLYGDVNGDGRIDETDDAVMKQAVVAFSPAFENQWFEKAADTNRDGAVDAFDASEIKLQLSGVRPILQK